MSDWVAPRRRANGGWIAAIITVSGSIIMQLLQVRAGDARALEYMAAGQSLDYKIDKLADRMNNFSERLTVIETERKQEAAAAAGPVPLIKGKKK